MSRKRDLFSKILKDEITGCWNWTGYLRRGYAVINDGGKSTNARRYMFREFVGAIPDSHQVVSTCGNRACVNPEHLIVSTRSVYRSVGIGSRLSGRMVEDASTGCWNWSGSRNACGYGTMGYKQKTALVHRVSYIHYLGEIPSGMQVLHKCDNPACFNPNHLFLGSHAENMLDKKRKGRDAVGAKIWCSKLTEVEVRDIRDRHASGDSNRLILSKEYGVDESTIRNVVSFKTWKHVV